MSIRPPSSRCQLKWKQFLQKNGGSWFLNVPPYYARLFDHVFPTIMRKSNTGWRDSTTGKTKYAFFPGLEDREITKINAFLAFFGRAVCVSINKNLQGSFSDELDFVLALDFNKPSPKEARTAIGEWEYRAKYQQNDQALGELVKEMVVAVRLPLFKKPRLLTFVPSDPGEKFYLPAALANAIVDKVPETFWGVPQPLVTAKLTSSKPSAKNLSVAQKIAQWEKILQAKGILLSRSVEGCSVIVVDDLYQSGASLWSFAKYLKDQGATSVVGLACVKSLRDTDNQ